MVLTASSLSPKIRHGLLISLLWVAVAILINPYGEFPFNDDWAYAQSVKALVEEGRFFVSGWTSVNLIVQVVWGALFCLPFGFSFTALRISTLAAGLMGLWGTYRLIDRTLDNATLALLGTVLLLVNPMYWGLSASFMTDVPFYTLVVWSLSYLVEGFRSGADRALWIGIFLAVMALLLRQLAIALFVSFALSYVVWRGVSVKNLTIAILTILLGIAVQMAYQRWVRFMMPGMVSYNVQAANFFSLSYYRLQLLKGFISNTEASLLYVGLFMFPYVLWIALQQGRLLFRAHRWLWISCAVIVIGLWLWLFDGIHMPVWMNVLTRFGLGPVLMRDIYFGLYTLPVPYSQLAVLRLITTLSVAGGIAVLFFLIRIIQALLTPVMARTKRSVGILLFTFLGIYYLPIGLQVLFDRYLLLMPVIILTLIHWLLPGVTPKSRLVPAHRYGLIGVLSLYLLYSILTTHDYLAWNRTRWQALHELMKQGKSPSEIDGGLEFNAYYLYDAHYQRTPEKSWWWVQDDTYVLGAGLLPNYTLVQQYDVPTWLPWGIRQIIVGQKTPTKP